jgi:hypothetical protein
MSLDPSSVRQTNPAYPPLSTPLDGDEGIRTPDLLRAREALSHLSYIPDSDVHCLSDGPQWTRTIDLSLIRGML